LLLASEQLLEGFVSRLQRTSNVQLTCQRRVTQRVGSTRR
jgi:hypothetical protein